MRRAVPTAIAAVLAVVLVAVVFTRCSAEGPATATAPGAPAAPGLPSTPSGTPEQQALAWTGSVCGALVPVVAHLTAAPPLDIGAPDRTRQAYLDYLSVGLTVTDRARADLAAAGAAPVVDGDVIAEQVRGNLADLRADVADARTQVERTDPGSAVSVARALVGGSRLVGALLNSAQVAGTINRDPVLHDAYDRSPECAQLQRSGRETAVPTVTPSAEPTR